MHRVMSILRKVFDLVTAAELILKISCAPPRSRAPKFMDDSYAHENRPNRRMNLNSILSKSVIRKWLSIPKLSIEFTSGLKCVPNF